MLAEVARAELLAFAERLHRARGLSRLDGTPSVAVKNDGERWWATAHLLGRVVSVPTGAWSGTDDGAAGVYGSGPTPPHAVACAVNAWRIVLRNHREDAERAEASAREAAEGWRRICAEVGA
jgi:hypothetical protein